jgi:hypothetical protein
VAGTLPSRTSNPGLDARWLQIAFLLSFLLVGIWARDFALRPGQVLWAVAGAVLTQAAWQWGLALPTRTQWGGYLSALVTSLGLSILVRAQTDWVHPLLAVLAISSKYLIRMGPAPTVPLWKRPRFNWTAPPGWVRSTSGGDLCVCV